MGEKEKVPAGGGTPTGTEQEKRQGVATFPGSYFTTDSTGTQTIFALLPQGEANAISSRDLANAVGASSVRELQNRIADERANGNLILSTCRNGGGYFRPSDGAAGQEELSRFISTIRSRATNTLLALRTAKAALDDGIAGQLDFDDLELL